MTRKHREAIANSLTILMVGSAIAVATLLVIVGFALAIGIAERAYCWTSGGHSYTCIDR